MGVKKSSNTRSATMRSLTHQSSILQAIGTRAKVGLQRVKFPWYILMCRIGSCCVVLSNFSLHTNTQNKRRVGKPFATQHNAKRLDTAARHGAYVPTHSETAPLCPFPVFSVVAQCHLALRVGILVKNFLVLLIATCYLWRPYLQRVQVGTPAFVR